MEKKVLSVRKYNAGYEIRKELCYVGDDEQPVEVKSAYTAAGEYIGNSKTAHFLIVKRGIAPESRKPDDPEANGGAGRTCSIGFCEKEQKWYGWSHRAMFGFAIGDTVKEGDCTASSGWIDEYLEEHPECDLSLPIGFIAKDLDDCKQMAIAFAESVS